MREFSASKLRNTMEPDLKSVTQLLNAWSVGDQEAGNELIGVVYQELRRLSAHYLNAERPGHTLQPTALVHELYLKMFGSEPVEWRDRGHFLAVAARQLRHILVDHARIRNASKRGGPQQMIPIDEAAELGVTPDMRVIELDYMLGRLAELDARAAQVVELRYFGGLTEAEISEALGISSATVKRDWEFARSWLLKEMGPRP